MSLVTNMSILNKVYCPREVFPLATMLVAAVDAAVSSVVLVVLFIAERFAPKPEALYAPVFLPALVMFTLGVTLGIAGLLVYVRDLRHALPLLVQFWLFATPVAYGVHVIAQTRAQLLLYSAINPLAPVIQGLRTTILLGHRPDWGTLSVGTASSAVILALGYWLFKRLETGIADIA